MKKDVVYIGDGGQYDGWVFLSCGLYDDVVLYYQERIVKDKAKIISFLRFTELGGTKLIKIGTL